MRFLSPGKKTWYPVQWLYGLISYITPLFRSNRPHPLLVFGAFHGDGYRGNTRVLFEYFLSEGTFEVVWLSRNPDVVKEVHKQFGTKAGALLHSPAGLGYMREATMVLYTHGISDFPFVHIPSQALQFHTYHGLPTKRGEYMKPRGADSPPSFLHKLILKYRFSGIDYFLSTSPFVSHIFAKRFNLREDQFAECGFPSLDALIGDGASATKSVPDTTYILLYAPTYRRRDRTKWFPFPDMDWTDFANFLEQHKITLMLRPHPNEHGSMHRYQSLSARIIDASEHPLSTLLREADAIITDYSGIYLEGLLLDIPPIFVPYDIDRYERGLPYSYEEVTPGPKVSSYVAFKQAISDALFEHAPVYAVQRKDVKHLFFKDLDGKATQRTAAFIQALLGSDEKQDHDLSSS